MLSQLFPQAALVTLALKFKGSSPGWHPPALGGQEWTPRLLSMNWKEAAG